MTENQAPIPKPKLSFSQAEEKLITEHLQNSRKLFEVMPLIIAIEVLEKLKAEWQAKKSAADSEAKPPRLADFMSELEQRRKDMAVGMPPNWLHRGGR